MARIRTVKPSFFTSETIAGLSDFRSRLGFVGLWTHCDDEGRCVDNAKLIRAAVFPLNDVSDADVEDMLGEWEGKHLIQRYQDEGRRFIAVTNWEEHQKVNRPSPSHFPSPDNHGGFSEDSLSNHPALTGGIRNKEQGIRNKERNASREPSLNFDCFWTIWPKKSAGGKGESHLLWAKLGRDDRRDALAGAQRHAELLADKPDTFVLPAGDVWLRNRRWEDDEPKRRPAPPPPNGALARFKARHDHERTQP
jgi:hypothetical protein